MYFQIRTHNIFLYYIYSAFLKGYNIYGKFYLLNNYTKNNISYIFLFYLNYIIYKLSSTFSLKERVVSGEVRFPHVTHSNTLIFSYDHYKRFTLPATLLIYRRNVIDLLEAISRLSCCNKYSFHMLPLK